MAEITQKLVDGLGLQTAMGIMGEHSFNGDKGVIGGFNQVFPLTTATKGNIYYHKGTNRYYICVDNYNGSSLTNPNSNFEELSVYTNRQRLDNLIKIKVTTRYFSTPNEWIDIPYPQEFDATNSLVLVQDTGEDLHTAAHIKLNTNKRQFFIQSLASNSTVVRFIFLKTSGLIR